MATPTGLRGHGYVLVAVTLFFISAAQATHWRYGTISWATCDGGFYDFAYPEVCLNCKSPLCVGVTIHTAIRPESVTTQGYWRIPARHYTQTLEGAISMWLLHVQDDVNAFIDDNTKRRLRLNRNTEGGVPNPYELRIGYMKGMNDQARPPSVSNPFEGVVECPVRPCPPTKENYEFYIDRLDRLENVVYAHYSFQIQFDENNDYSVYMDGCCRPSDIRNKFELPFHLRAGIQLYAAGQVGGTQRPYPKQSMVVNMPNTVMLRSGGVAYDECAAFPCGEKVGQDTVCFMYFRVQTYHPIVEYRDKLVVRMANAGEGGWWRCGGGLAGGQRSSPEWAALCNQRTSELSFAEPDLSSMQKRVDGDGYGIYFVKFLVSRTGVQAGQVIGLHSLNLMVDCVGCVNGVTQSVPIEITVRIKEASVNFDPPFVTTNPNPIVDVLGIQGAVPASCQQAPIQIYCGRTRFEMGNGGSMYSQDFLRISFKDFDDGTSAQICSGSAKALPQQIKLIQEASTLPTGVRLGTLVAGGSLEGVGNVDYLNPAGAAYVDLTWRPSCENPSDLGLKQFCFTSRDTYYDASLQEDTNFPYLWSPPSLLDTKGFIDTSNPMCPMPQGLRSSCYFVNSQAPKTNILPEFVEPTTSKGRECSAGCCDCCGQENCNCQATLQCCTTLYTTIGRVFTHVVRAVDGPIYASEASEPYFPLRDDHDSYQLEIDFTFPGNIVPAPIVGTMKYGCGATPYAQCTSNPNRKADVLTELVWDLRGLGFSCYKPNANTTSRCTGTDDTSTCNVALGGSSCTKDPVPLPFSVCYRAKELIAPWVNVTLWRRTYKESPVRDSCDVCFILAIADRPVFLEDDDVSPAQGAIFEIPAGREFKIPLTAAAANDAGVVVTSILSDPGAPVGATLGPPRKVLCNEVRAVCELFHQSGYQRYFSFYPSVEHGGQRFEACFRASMEVIKADADLDSQVSEPRCITIKVLQATPSWDGTTPCDGMNGACAPQGHIISTVGCNIAYHLQAVAPLYDLSIQHQDLATCSNCVDGGVAVHSCSETGNKWPCCGNGHCDGAEIGSNCPADCRPDDSSLTLLQTASKSNGYVSRAELKWKPTRGMEGRRLLSCFAATDTLLGTGIVNKDRSASSAPSYCVVVDVERCRYCVPDGSSMVYIAKQYVLNVDWLRLYNTNPGVSDPDGVFPYEKLVIGPTYTVHPGDSLLSIAGSAKTTLKSILENNPDILDDSYLMEGQKICLLLCSASSA